MSELVIKCPACKNEIDVFKDDNTFKMHIIPLLKDKRCDKIIAEIKEKVGELKANDWPVVYIYKEKEYDKNKLDHAYIGETTSIERRTLNHLKGKEEIEKSIQKSDELYILEDDIFNKSVIVDLESYLITHMANIEYNLYNRQQGQTRHNYFLKKSYEKMFSQIWDKLRNEGLVKNDIRAIESEDIYKFSPYKILDQDQFEVVNTLISVLSNELTMGNTKESSFVIEGGAGTGKTILATYLMKFIKTPEREKLSLNPELYDIDPDFFDEIKKNEKQFFDDPFKNLKVGVVVPMTNLRESLYNVFVKTSDLKGNMILGPTEVVKNVCGTVDKYTDEIEKYDLLIVDEAHRLKRNKNLGSDIGAFKNASKIVKDRFNMSEDVDDITQLDWILKCSKHQIFFYDKGQTIKPTDIRETEFNDKVLSKLDKFHRYELKTQKRVYLGGDKYIKYIKELFSDNPPKTVIKEFGNSEDKYDFKIYTDPNKMIDDIKELNKTNKLCRTLAGYSFSWHSNNGKKLKIFSKEIKKKYKELCNEELSDDEINKILEKMTNDYINDVGGDFKFGKRQYIWNSQQTDWINSPNSINEIGCIHTSQGFDLNYAGIIIGDELKARKKSNGEYELYIDASCYKDKNGWHGLTDLNNEDSIDYKELKQYIFNIYQTMMLRGIEGTYVYARDPVLEEYLKKYISA